MILISRGLDFRTETKGQQDNSKFYAMCSCEGAREDDTISGGNGVGVPPVPIPNTEVKTYSAESTWLDTAREDRSPPDSIRGTPCGVLLFCFPHGKVLK